MGTGITVDLQIDGLKSFDPMLEFTNPKLWAKAVKGGIKYAAKAGAPQAAKSVASRYTIKSARIKQDIKGPFIYGDTATLVFSRRGPTLNQFSLSPGKRGGTQPGLGRGMGWGKPSPKGKPITAKIFKDGQRQTYRGVFMVNGLPMRYIRAKNKFEVAYGPSIGSEIFGKGRYATTIRTEVAIRMNEQFITGMQRVLDSASRGYGNG
jgi:hypothetical protein